MTTKTLLSVLAALALSTGTAIAQEGGDDHSGDGESSGGGHGETHITDYQFPFEGAFGSYDSQQLQRGLKIYTEVCSACHGMEHVPIRTLQSETGPAMPEDQVRAYAEMWDVWDEDIRDFRTAEMTDHFPESSLENAPDLSLMAKARAGFSGPYGTGISQLVNGMGGPEYIASLLTGYTGETMTQAGTTLYENTAFEGGWIAMAPPLYGDDVSYNTDAPTTIEQEAQDVAAFLMWAAEPKMAQRKAAGLSSVIFLAVLAVLLYLTNKRLWKPIKDRAKQSGKGPTGT